MRIINHKIKDYYDYLQGVYGIDEDITFDRDEPIIISQDETNSNLNLDTFFYNRYLKHVDCYNSTIGKYFYRGNYNHKYCFVLEVGYKQYVFEVERYITEKDDVYFKPRLLKIIDDNKKYSEYVISIIPLRIHYEQYPSLAFDNNHIIKNPILRSTYVPSFINAETIYNDIYNYLINTNEKELIDDRDDTLKILSHGFDTKTSFRNPIISKKSSKK